MGEQTLHYYLRVYSIILLSFILLISLYIFYVLNKENTLINNLIIIEKGETLEKVIRNNISDVSIFDIFIIKNYYRLNIILDKKYFHYGDFYLDKKINIFNLLNKISKPSNVLNKITIVEGWSQEKLYNELSKYFDDISIIPYEDIIADTYYFAKNSNFNTFINKLLKLRNQYFKKYNQNILLEKFTKNQLFIIGSLIEKEGLDYEDKKKIASVIFNRLNIKMKLQIDATVLFSITNGKYDLKRNLTYEDLKIDHPYNTYMYNGLPPKPISYVGRKTLDIIFENNQTDFLFYFFNNSLNRHIFSNNYEEHKRKLNDFRSNK